jgi:aminoglycoside N3'-acetyltransferase
MIGRAMLVDQLTRLGVQPASSLMVHASLRKIGPIDGGADTLLDALIETLGPRGTLLMVLGADDEHPFDALSSPVDEDDMGVLAEVFRQRQGVRINDHAAARYGAIGPQSLQLLEPVSLHDYHGPGSVLARFIESGGVVLRLGAAVDTVTLTHLAEYLARVPNKRRVRRRYERADIGEQWIEGLDDDGGIVDWEQGDYFPQILLDFLKTGQARIGPVGDCTAELFPARTFVDFAVEWMEARLTTRVI